MTHLRKNCTLSLLFLTILFTQQLTAQETLVTIKVVNTKKEAVPFATINLFNKADSTLDQSKVADSSGESEFRLKKGHYTVNISSVNYQFLEKRINITANQRHFTFTVEELPKTLTGVTITTSRPLMRQEDDKTVVDPENLVAMSTNGYEVLEKTPGLFIDQDGNIYISSMTPATVYINGRDMKMSADDMATLLKNLPPNAISKIEIMRTPSAKYDATSSGGIVNVVLRRGVKIGKTGSINAGMQQGVYGNQFIGFSLNNNDGKRNSYINLNYGSRNRYQTTVTNRWFAIDSLLSQNARTKYPTHYFYAGYGIGDSLGKNWDVSFSGNISYNNFNNTTNNESTIEKESISKPLADNLNRVNNNGNSLTINNGIDAKMKIDSTGSEWDNTIFYTNSHKLTNQVFSTEYFFPVLPSTSGDGSGKTNRNYFYVTSDLKLKTKNRFTFETGIKSSLNRFENKTNYFTESGSIRTKDPSRTNTFHYTENINSAYVQGSQTFGKDIILKAGVRFENTNMDGRQLIPYDTSFTIHRTDLFPYVFLSKNIMQIAGYDLRAYLVYRRTISRPSYSFLNPFPRYVDQYMYETGNPSLRPQFTQNYEANISIDERPVAAIGINDTRDIFTNVTYQSDTSKSVAYRTYDNLGNNKELYLRALAAIPPGKRYFFVIVAQYNHNFYQGQYENQPLSYKKGSWTFFTYQSLKLGKHSQLSLHGFMRLKGQQQFYELSPFGSLNASINRKFLKDKLTITLSMNDIFFTNKNDFTIHQGSINAFGSRQNDSRRGGLNIRYNFGIQRKAKEEKKFPDIESQ